MQKNSNFWWHVLGLMVACFWGSTFVASKVLLNHGLNPAEIMTFRFAIAWVLMLPFSGRFDRVDRSKCSHIINNKRSRLFDEFLFLLLGLSGGSLYFLAENTAVDISSATSTVALLVCTTPIITALMNRVVHRAEHLSNRFLLGSLIALVGVALVVFNGVFVLDDDPAVILLSVGASALWGVYSLIIRVVEDRYSSFTITRKVFFWGVVTMLPVVLWKIHTGESQLSVTLLTSPVPLFTLLFLALVASLGCFLLWNIVIKRIGIIVSGNYLYFNPVTSLFVAYWVLDENITLLAIVGCLLTIAGVYLCNKTGN